jgi:formylglycine-generating enzyme required for sulfatase activity
MRPAALLAALAAALWSGLGRSAPAPVHADRKQLTSSVGMKLVLIPKGKFMMGSPAGEAGRRDDEQQHEVEITKPFYLGVYEVTQAEYQKVTGTNPSQFRAVPGQDTTKFPVENVSWGQAVEFCKKLSDLPAEKGAHRVYRLPTEAEWEYACRAGAREYAIYHYGKSLSSTQANFTSSGLNRPVPVGSYKPNAWGLFDMHGNVWEWCADWYDAQYYRKSPKKDPPGPDRGTWRVARGGGWNIDGSWCRSAYRGWDDASRGHNRIGFRVACVRR